MDKNKRITYFHTQSRELNDEETNLLVDALNAMVGGHVDNADELFLKLTKTQRALEFAGGLCDIVEENASIRNMKVPGNAKTIIYMAYSEFGLRGSHFIVRSSQNGQ